MDTETGWLSYANGGHNPPLHVMRGGGASWLPSSGGLVVGAMEGITYRRERLLLEPGDDLFLYTDGVTEAMNGQDEAFSDERLERNMCALQARGLREIVDGIMASIRSFTGGAPQSDDITMMMIQYNGKQRG
jgi:sigma-B regulation protein RsbU (phosphoserine phosphatase)